LGIGSFAALATLIALADAQQAPAPQPQTFRSGAQIVEVDVRVLKDGRFVNDLGPSDFQVSEDGVPQKIESVVLVAPAPPAPLAPSALPAPAPLAPSAPPAPSAPQAAHQVWLFVFDTVHLTPGPFQRARDAAATFVAEKFRDGDLGGVVIDGRMANNRLTTSRDELKAALTDAKLPGDLRGRQLEQREWPRLLDEFEAYRIVNNDQEAIRNAAIRACSEDPDACKRAPADVQVMQKARQVVDGYRVATNQTLVTLTALCNGLARIPGSKTVVLFSEGFVVQQMESQVRQAAGQAARAGAHFYTIDARGLNKGAGAQIIDQAQATAPSGPSNTFDMQADGTNSLAVDTGGMAIRNENNFGRALDEIQKDASTYYVVAYAASNTTFDGKYRAIDVKVARPGVKIRARRGYLALEPSKLLTPTRPSAPSAPSARPDVLVSPGMLAMPEVATAVSSGARSGEAPSPGAPAAATSAAGRADAGRMVAALGRDSASARVRPTGEGTPGTPAERGWTAYERGDVETALRELGEAAKAQDARPWVVYALGLSQFALRQYRDAAQSWERVRKEAPEFEPIYFTLADAYGLQHEDSAALKVLRDAEARWPGDAEVANATGVIHVRRGALDAAIESFERATRVAPSEGLGFFNLARTHQMRLLKSQRYDRQREKWIGGDEDRRRAIANFEKYLKLGGPYEQQAREALATLSWK
jgi:VWFA-related protein